MFQSLVGPDLDADGLLEPARQLATKRVVVKRPDYAPPLADVATTNAVTTKGHRFDIYSGTPEKAGGGFALPGLRSVPFVGPVSVSATGLLHLLVFFVTQRNNQHIHVNGVDQLTR